MTGCLKQGYQNYYKPCKIKIYDRGAVIEYFLKIKLVVESGQLKLSNGYTHNMEVKFLLDFDFLTFTVVNHVKNKDGTIALMKTPNITDFKCKMRNFKSE